MNRVTLATAALGLAFCACAGWSPGTDPKGRDLIASGNELVAEIEAHKQRSGGYPDSLADLSLPVSIGRPGSDFHFHYEPKHDDYNLFLNYTPSWPQSGRVACAYGRANAEWNCAGYL
jgi:hypothetical protein